MADTTYSDYILGLDLGVTSVGWALIPTDYSKISVETLKMGVRIFDAGTDGNLEEGKDESKNLKRRTARGVRRNFWRRRRRAVKLFNILQSAGLLPSVDCHTPEARQTLFNTMDAQLRRLYFSDSSRVVAQTYLYRLRALALDSELTPHAIGRIFYALGQRRGFQSNKKVDPDASEDSTSEAAKELGKVKGAIADLEKDIEATGARTLGEYFSRLDPEEQGARIRGRWVGRKSYVDEFEKIWDAQKKYHPALLTDQLREKIFKALFYQRPLKSQKNLVSRCELEPRFRCIAKADPLFQRFRYWQRILDLRVYDPNEGDCGGMRSLTREEQDLVAVALDSAEKVSFNDIRKMLGFKKPAAKKSPDDRSKEYWKFNFELDGDNEKVMIGNKTRAKIVAKLAEIDAPDRLYDEIESIAREAIFYDSDVALAKKFQTLFGLDYDAALTLAKVRLEPDYGSLSRKAIAKLLPVMIEGEARIPFAEARKKLYGERILANASNRAVDLLEPVSKALGAVRNPTVTRALTETRKVVNAIIRKWGKPAYIRVELARDLKKGRKEREKIFRNNKAREKERERAKEAIVKEMGEGFPVTNRDILKYRLYQECAGVCPYTGKSFSLGLLFSKDSPIDIEHIIPFSRSLDDSFGNKTLCFAEENRHVKKNRTPYETYAKTDKWNEILLRVRAFRGVWRDRKYQLFTTSKAKDEIMSDASTRLLNDTRYISRLAVEYLGTLYGAVNSNDAEGNKRVFVVTGGMTGWLRDAWNLNVLLLSPDEKQLYEQQPHNENDVIKKNRADHRHHAIDAVVVALTDTRMVQILNKNAEVATELETRRLFALQVFEKPCDNFQGIVQAVVDNIVVSRRVDRKVSGPLHEETNYSARTMPGAKGEWRAIRKPLTSMSAKDVDNIVDPRIRAVVSDKLAELGGDPKKFEGNPPVMLTSSNPPRQIVINKTRFWKSVKTLKVGKGRSARYNAPGSNHHMEIYAVLDAAGNEVRWEARVVSLFEAYRRRREHEPVIQRDFGPNTRFKFSLALNEAFMLEGDSNIYIVRVVSEDQKGRIALSSKYHTDARTSKEILATKGLIFAASTLQGKGLSKVQIGLLGEVTSAND